MSPDLGALLRADTPFIDLRSPGEFAAGAVPCAVNLPLLTDVERARVGKTYKDAGQGAAIRLGHSLVEGKTKAERLSRWQDFITGHPQAWLYCWRGGLRSETVQTWLAESGIHIPRVAGGFKALRHHCLETLARAPEAQREWLVLGGKTGSGKTQLLQTISWSIDLEGLANHRGSAFGARTTEQPAPIGFENALAVAYIKHQHPRLLLEDESRLIGRMAIPPAWHARMQRSPLLILEVDKAIRCANICREYIDEPLAAGTAASALFDHYHRAIDKIRRRLGGQRTSAIHQELRRGFETGAHEAWVMRLLEWYYDPMYDYQLGKKRTRVIAEGDRQDLAVLLEELGTNSACS
ncbi:MAG: tRNA 2-selenouridine(34) synthase MnmH [Pseudomonadales bacterium]|nr:tRNA 2-selenouridine(34) synthase MnmH [Pseudomonadales bacterium]